MDKDRTKANGLVERMHMQLKAAAKARSADHGWLDELPLVLLRLCSAWQEGACISPAELVYGTALLLPAQFVLGTEGSTDTPTNDSFAQALFGKMKALRPVPSKHHGRLLPSSHLR